MSDYSAIFNCPGCGSPLEILEGTISLRCTYCGLIMRLGSPGRILKYFYESKLDGYAAKLAAEKYIRDKGLSMKYSETALKLFHIPFYRFRGMSYALFSENVFKEPEEGETELPVKKVVFQKKCRHFDLTIPAFENSSFGLDSLGVRPEVMPLTVFQKGNFPSESTLVDLTLSPDEAEQKAMAMFFFGVGLTALSKEYLSSEMIGEGLSVIYYPIWAYEVERDGLKSTLFIDGLAKRVYNETPGEFEYDGRGIDNSRAVELNPVQHKCPNCGFDLPVSKWSLHYYCGNCERSYVLNDDRYIPVKYNSASFENGTYYHPFWKFPFAAGEADTVGKFSKILTGEIPLIARSKANNQFCLYIPAFRSANLNSMTILGERLCRVQPELQYDSRTRPPAVDMVLPESEGLELARFYWNLLRSRYMYLSGPDYDFESCTVGKGELVWLGLGNSYGVKGKYGARKTISKYSYRRK